MIMMTKLQDKSPWTRIILPRAGSFLEDKQNSRQRQDVDQSGYYSEVGEFDSVSMTLVTTSEASTAGGGWNREQEGTFDH